MRVLLLTLLLILCSSSSASSLDFGVMSFMAEGCPPCAVMKHTWQDKEVMSVMKERGFRFRSLDVKYVPKTTLFWRVRGTPTTIIVELDKKRNIIREVNRFQGPISSIELSKILQDVK